MHKDRLGSVDIHVAIQGVCAWPNLTRFPDGTVVATIFNQPCHGRWEGDLDCWATTDGGDYWSFRGRPCPHEEGTNRMNCAAGLANSGDMIVLCSGWTNRVKPYGEAGPFSEAQTLRAWVCRSSDQARTWQRVGELPASPGVSQLIPFGNIVTGEDGSLRATAYTAVPSASQSQPFSAAFMLISRDDGSNWEILAQITDDGNETDILPLGGGRWLAAGRTPGRVLKLHTSEDDGRSWRFSQALSLPYQIPGNLLKLADGRIVVSYGNRCPNNLGVDARVSADDGATWSRPIRLANMPPGDGGYPSSVQLDNGRILTAFYKKNSGEFHYEMSVAVWNVDDFEPSIRQP